MKCFVTGGAGFIGSHLINKLLSEGHEVTVYDNLSTGKKEFLLDSFEKYSQKLTLITADLLDKKTLEESIKNHDFVFHLAANADVKIGQTDREIHFQQNVVATKNVLDAMVLQNVKNIAFTSSSTVYGVASIIPTPESYGPCIPTSIYGASKLADEAFICAYADNYKFNATIFRLANIVGRFSNHGIIPDFIKKLKANPKELTILGDGCQKKSYVYVDDCVSAIKTALKNINGAEIFNVGSEDVVTTKEIAGLVVVEMGLTPNFKFTGGESWKGDITTMLLSSSKLKAKGWKAAHNSKAAVTAAIKDILRDE